MDPDVAELVSFTSKEAYVYAPIPAATSYGHRAEIWNPDEWLQEVKIKVVTAGDLAFVRLLDKDTGELFAECPLPHDGTPLTTAVEPVVDSSRYFVAKVVDSASRKHAFIGIGFRDRMDASDFSAALDDYRQYIRRKHEAEQMRQEFENLTTAEQQQPDTADGASVGAVGIDYSLRPGQTIKLNLSSMKSQAERKRPDQQQQVSPGSLKLPPPPSRSKSGSGESGGTFFKLQQNPASAASVALFAQQNPAAAAGATPLVQQLSAAADSGSNISAGGSLGHQVGEHHLAQGTHRVLDAVSESVTVGEAAAVSDDDWGDFVS